MYFAKNMLRLLADQKAGKWEQFYMEDALRQHDGIVGYGEIGRASAEKAKAFGMKVLALRRRPELSSSDPLVDGSTRTPNCTRCWRLADYIVVAAPNTPGRIGLIGAGGVRGDEIECSDHERRPRAGDRRKRDDQALSRGRSVAPRSTSSTRSRCLRTILYSTLPNVLLSSAQRGSVDGWLERPWTFSSDNFDAVRKGEQLMKRSRQTGGLLSDAGSHIRGDSRSQ